MKQGFAPVLAAEEFSREVPEDLFGGAVVDLVPLSMLWIKAVSASVLMASLVLVLPSHV